MWLKKWKLLLWDPPQLWNLCIYFNINSTTCTSFFPPDVLVKNLFPRIHAHMMVHTENKLENWSKCKKLPKSDFFFLLLRKPNPSISFLFAHSSKNSLRYALEVEVNLIEFITLVLFSIPRYQKNVRNKVFFLHKFLPILFSSKFLVWHNFIKQDNILINNVFYFSSKLC